MIDEEKVMNEEEIKEEEIQEEEIPEEEVSEEEKQEETSEEPKEEESGDLKYMRLMADFQNYKRRTDKEKADVFAYANEKMATGILDVMDNFERALEHKEEGPFGEGMELIFKMLSDVLKNNNVEEIQALGEDFDPNFHNAVMTEDSEEYESGKVSAVLQKGYTLNGKVIRPAMVKVVN